MRPSLTRRSQANVRMERYALWSLGRGESFREVAETALALQALPESMREVLVAHYLQAGTAKAKARALGMQRPEFYWTLALSLEALLAMITARKTLR